MWCKQNEKRSLDYYVTSLLIPYTRSLSQILQYIIKVKYTAKNMKYYDRASISVSYPTCKSQPHGAIVYLDRQQHLFYVQVNGEIYDIIYLLNAIG